MLVLLTVLLTVLGQMALETYRRVNAMWIFLNQQHQAQQRQQQSVPPPSPPAPELPK